MSVLPARVLAIALCLITSAVNLPAPLYPVYALRSGAGAGATAIAFAGYVAGVVPVLLLFGGLGDRVGRKPLIATALLLGIGGTLLLILAPGLYSLALARCLLGVGTGMASTIGVAYMAELIAAPEGDTSRAASWVAASTSIGFGLGAAVTSVFLLRDDSLTPGSFWLQIGLTALALLALVRMPDPAPRRASPMLRLPCYPKGSVKFGAAILLAWATSGIVIAVLPAMLASHGQGRWSGFSTFSVISCGLLFQPLARRLAPSRAVTLGLCVLPPSFAVIAWGALHGQLWAVLLGAVGASSACYGFIYLGGLAAVAALAGAEKARASAGFFLLAYAGFSLPVVITGQAADCFGPGAALWGFGTLLTFAAIALLPSLLGRPVVSLRPGHP